MDKLQFLSIYCVLYSSPDGGANGANMRHCSKFHHNWVDLYIL